MALFLDKISSRYFKVDDDSIVDVLRNVEDALNQRLRETKFVTLNHVYDLLDMDRAPYGNEVGWIFNPWKNVNVYGKPEQFVASKKESCIVLHFDPEPEPWEEFVPPYNVSIPRRSGKTLNAETMEYIHEKYLEYRKENNMKSKSDIPCILARQSDYVARQILADVAGLTVNDTTNSLTTRIIIGKKGDPRGVHAVELKIKNVIFNDPATIVFWSDDTKTVVKAGPNDAFDPEKGLAMAISKKVLGNNYKAYGRFKKWLPKEYNNAASEK